jgi:hypothetical protein
LKRCCHKTTGIPADVPTLHHLPFFLLLLLLLLPYRVDVKPPLLLTTLLLLLPLLCLWQTLISYT